MLIHNTNLDQYLGVVVFFAVATALSVIMVSLPRLLAVSKPERDKLSSYECGFDPIGDAHAVFDISFYLVAILFIIFDLEIAFLIPWAISLSAIGMIGFYSMMVFLFVLTAGFIYEWKKGALEW
jgi:NADH-quinone oxidoreductase subunit A